MLELQDLKAHGTWEVVPMEEMKRKGLKPISARWVYKIKRNSDHSVARYKARLVARGFLQKQGIDFNETFASVARMKTLRVLCALAISHKLKITQIDFDNAFLNGILEEEIYMSFPPGYPGPPGNIIKLIKSIYGLKQACRTWQCALVDALKECDFEPFLSEPCVFKHSKSLFLISVHVDDMLLVTADEKARSSFLKKLKTKFRLKDLGPLSYYLGFEAEISPSSIFLHQTSYFENVLSRFNMSDCKTAETPAPPKSNRSLTDARPDFEKPYRQLVGSALYGARGTIPPFNTL
jgi:hypothetical protein